MAVHKPFVSFVSAGPGAADLLTLRALDRIKSADVILFDYLAAGPVLDHVLPGARLVCVGKRARRASVDQADLNTLLVETALQFPRVVRLKSGDAGLFGRLEEEISALDQASIDYEIVPGVSSANAAAALAGIPLTRRGAAMRVQFLTGHDLRGGIPRDLDIEALVDPHVTTVFFMGRRTFPPMLAGLIARGLDPKTPALLGWDISLPGGTFRRGDVQEIADLLTHTDETRPALIIMGPLMHRVKKTSGG